jgi:Mn2+/Fe2+ NRAMP family transporter
MTGTYAGQFVMEGFLNLKLVLWQRVAFTRGLGTLHFLWSRHAAFFITFASASAVCVANGNTILCCDARDR